MENKVYEIKHNRYSGHFMYIGDHVTIEKELASGLLLARSTYGNKQFTSTVHKDEIEEVKGVTT